VSLRSHMHNNETLSEIIRQRFFLSDDATLSPELIAAYLQSEEEKNFTKLAPYTLPLHTDSFQIHITHDIDWINPLHPYSMLNYVRSLVSKHPWFTPKQLFNKQVLIENIAQLLQLEKELAVRSLFCIGANANSTFNRYAIRYKTSTLIYKPLLKLIKENNQSIGLHSGYQSVERKNIMVEKNSLEHFTNKPVLAHRSHYLQHNELLYEQLDAAEITYDLGNGRIREVGLINGFPGKIKPINTKTGGVYNCTTIPLFLTDNVFFVKPYYEVLKEFKRTLQQLKNYRGSGCILFHPENMLLKPQLWNYFEEIIHICKQEGANLQQPLT
jgi:hypothetical protein